MTAGSAVPVPATHLDTARDAEAATRKANEAMAARLPFADQRDFEAARRGLIAEVPDGVVQTPNGTVLWNLNEYAFIDGEPAPATVNPSLWRMARLNLGNGLFKVTERVYQLRGFDISNMTVLEGDDGLILIDPLTTAEVARAALALYFAHRPKRAVVAVIYTHSHVDHYGGVRGVIEEAEVKAGRVEVIAPAGFMEAISGENVLAGLPMMRRAQFQFGHLLPRGPRGQVDAGLGKAIARGTPGLIAPTRTIEHAVEEHTIAGLRIVFQLAPETEAPAEMHMFYPDLGVLNMAENACPLLHNFIPLRGAVARDPRIWAKYIADAIEMYAPHADVLIGQHHWPTWGRDAILDHLEAQRDLYKHIHDQTLRLMNRGWRPAEIAEAIDLPAGLAERWSARGYYGTVNHNVKAVYQRYLSWYDGNPCNLHPLPPAPAARKLVEYMGGAAAVIARAREDFARGEFRWVAQVMKEVVYAEPHNREARALCADALEQMGYQAESATWRNAFLYGAQELRHDPVRMPPRALPADTLAGLSTDIFFDMLAIRLDPAKAAGRTMVLNWHFTDRAEQLALTLRHGTLTHRLGSSARNATASITTTRATLDAIILGRLTPADALASGALRVEGEAGQAAALLAMLDPPSPMMFDILTPGEGRP
ncbi:alkyl sulfatase dimerization domain-containing protein [Enhydrobacter sp.]|jgi:alkyl sulfatase BDS1-like metallo-beta-lactamase superfamily hydrolase|uniref:alkyl/aryl-sulfatase n=1 Tax=Enhydrobacter sp. TaxID=1894999 RepID=UPI002613EC8B|nr:alkyl sulfatase dimerization domain-containing protein [Enhydrobacter sp.]WIM13405.1 MAG: MBL-fold metallo-hydrolase family protein [Enhydrobacter sp.]